MKSFRQELWFNVPTRMDFLNITSQVEKCVRDSGVREGMCLVNAMQKRAVQISCPVFAAVLSRRLGVAVQSA